jgi:hypothetical protein
MGRGMGSVRGRCNAYAQQECNPGDSVHSRHPFIQFYGRDTLRLTKNS